MMSGIKGKNTSPEVLVRKALHARGFRFRIHVNNLPGKPDLVLPKYKAVIFVHGCFWHGHSCRYFKVPKTRQEFWLDKIGKNQSRDYKNLMLLRAEKWRVLVVWECAVRAMKKHGSVCLMNKISDWLVSGADWLELEEGTSQL
jgi:DNA mismatch endonuclease (patch repair protein)